MSAAFRRRACLGFVLFAAGVRAEPPSVCVETIDGRRCAVTIEKWSLGGPLQLAGANATTQPLGTDEISRVTNVTVKLAEQPGRWRVVTTDQQELFGEIEKGGENRMAVRNALIGAVDLPLDAIRRIEPSALARRTGADAPATDRVLLVNGDRIEGVVERVDAAGVRLQSTEGDDARTLTWDVIRRLDFANPPVTPSSARAALLRLADGSTLRVDKFNWEGGSISADVFTGRHVRIPATALRAVEPLGGRRVWLSEIEPAAYKHNPKLGPTFELGRDAACTGQPLRVDERGYDRGLGLHSACRGEWKLDRHFTRLRGLAAIDDSAGPLADATLRITIDGREVARFEHLRHAEPPRPIDLDLSKADSLVIEVDYGDHADVQDRVDLLDAALIRN